jgi:hypothetical protein
LRFARSVGDIGTFAINEIHAPGDLGEHVSFVAILGASFTRGASGRYP